MSHILRCCKIKVQPLILTKTACRQYIKVSEKMESLLKQHDHVPRDYSLVYRQEKKYIPSMAYHLVNILTVGCLGLISYSWYKYNRDPTSFTEIPDFIEVPYLSILAVLYFIMLATLCTVIRGRFPIRIYYSEKNKLYKPIFVGKIPFSIESYEFPQESLVHATKSDLPWQTSLFRVPNGRKILLFSDKFKTYSDFEKMFKKDELKI